MWRPDRLECQILRAVYHCMCIHGTISLALPLEALRVNSSSLSCNSFITATQWSIHCLTKKFYNFDETCTGSRFHHCNTVVYPLAHHRFSTASMRLATKRPLHVLLRAPFRGGVGIARSLSTAFLFRKPYPRCNCVLHAGPLARNSACCSY